MKNPLYQLFFVFIVFTFFIQCSGKNTTRLEPQIDGNWWQVAGNPDLGELTSEKQEPVDFGIWQAADGTWQIWSCIRKTNAPGNTRLFYRWQGKDLFDTDWEPMGIAMMSDTTLGEALNGLQAPHVVQAADSFLMFYGEWYMAALMPNLQGIRIARMEWVLSERE